MKIKDLVKELNNLNPDSQILVQGYESGYDDIVSLKEIKIFKKRNANNWDGEYDDAENRKKNVIKSVIIFGNRR